MPDRLTDMAVLTNLHILSSRPNLLSFPLSPIIVECRLDESSVSFVSHSS